MKRLFEVLSPRRRYHEKKPLASALLRLLDVLLLALPRRDVGSDREQEPKRILLMNPAYIGDVLLSTSVLPLLRQQYPDAEIGFVVGSWSRQVVDRHPDVKHVHVVDVFRLIRSKISLRQKLGLQRSTQRQAEVEIKALDYDLAIDLFTGFPPLSWLAWKCGIPRRIGYLNRGFGALLTDAVQQDVVAGKHEAMYHADLAVKAGAVLPPTEVFPALPIPDAALEIEVAGQLGWSSLSEHRYIVMHPGTGEVLKEWPLAHWRELTRALIDSGHRLIFTGHGARDTAQIDGILEGQSGGAINLCGQLTWPKLCALMRRASLLIGVDSMSGHLAAAWQIPTITLSTGMSDPHRWRPANAGAVVLHTAPACLPCLGRTGCESMQCLRGVTSQQVLSAAVQSLRG